MKNVFGQYNLLHFPIGLTGTLQFARTVPCQEFRKMPREGVCRSRVKMLYLFFSARFSGLSFAFLAF
jgi:hypothetical protein